MRTKWWRGCRLAVVVGLVLATMSMASRVESHPLGNFTVNRYARLEASAGAVRVYYVLDEAEIPAFQERRAVRADPEGFADRRAREIGDNLSLLLDGQPARLQLRSHLLTQPEGQGGLPLLRLAVLFEADLADVAGLAGWRDRSHRVAYSDTNQPDRLGWREVVVTARGDARLLESSAPARDQSDELRRYPEELLESPLDVRTAAFSYVPGNQAVEPLALDRPGRAPARPGGRLAALASQGDVGPLALFGILAVALGVGAAHALGPGHGKTIMAAYLAGADGRPRDAMLIGGVVSLMHTGSVIVLGLVLFLVARTTPVERVYPVLTLCSGVAVLGLGIWLLRRRLADLGHRRAHVHAHAHDHDHGHGALSHSHGHDDDGVAPLSRRGLVLLAGSGGILPSPSAVIVLVSAFSLGHAVLGLAVVAAFSVGMALTLSAVGLALIFGRRLLQRRVGRVLPVFPVLGAAALVVVGVVVSVQGLGAL
jgi:nickel/cobalt exporter